MKRFIIFLIVISALILNFSGVLFAQEDQVLIEENRKVVFDYTLTVDGEVFDTSEGKKPIEYVHGDGSVIAGLSSALEGMKVGDEKNVVVGTEDAYGEINPEEIREIPSAVFPGDFEREVGTVVEMISPEGNNVLATIMEERGENLVLNFNHPLAGKVLTFDVKIVSVE